MQNNIDEPKYIMIKQYIKHLLKENLIGFGQKLPSEHELMEKFKVSRHTIRQAFSELTNSGLIYKEQGKGTFSKYIKSNNQKKIIAVITTYISDYIFPHIISGIEEVLSEEGYSMLLSNTNNNKEREAHFIHNIIDHNVVGLIIEPTKSAEENVNLPLFRELSEKNIKTVFINALYPDFESSFVMLDDEKGMYLATEYLLQLGHRKIVGIFKKDDLQGVKRKNGYINALKNHGFNKEDISFCEYETANQYIHPYMYTQSYLRSQNQPTAFVCYNDSIAMMVIQAVKDSGLRVPEDISVVGFDDSSKAVDTEIKLTTVSHPKKMMGTRAASFIIDMLEQRIERPQIVFQPELVVRYSCREIK